MSVSNSTLVAISLLSSLAFLTTPYGRKMVFGFGAQKPAWTAKDIPDLSGKVIVVTGGNNGIGYVTVEELVRHGAKVYMAARNGDKAKAAIDKIKETSSIPEDRLIWLPLDLSKLKSVAKAADTLLANEERLDVLVNNAGVATTDYVTTEDGFEQAIQVNHIGHWLLTTRLLPLLKRTAAAKDADVRVINLSSDAHGSAPAEVNFVSTADFNYPGGKPGSQSGWWPLFRRYSLSKLTNILFTKELQNRLDIEKVDIIAIAVHPGAIDTEGVSSVMPFAPLRLLFSWLSATREKGAQTSLFAATAPEVKQESHKYKGKYLCAAPRKLTEPSGRARNPELAKNLWTLTEDTLKGLGY